MSIQKKIIFVLLGLAFIGMPGEVLAEDAGPTDKRTWGGFFNERVNPFYKSPKIVNQDPTTSERFSRTIKRNLNPCYATNCKSLAGLINCLITDPQFAKYETPDKFFFKTTGITKDINGNEVRNDSAQTFITRPVKVILYSKKVQPKTEEGQEPTEAYDEAILVDKVVNVISPRAYKAFQTVARENPNCMEVFCKHNCLLVDQLDQRTIDTQAAVFLNSGSDVWIKGKKYVGGSLSKDNMDIEDVKKLAEQFLLERRNSIISLRCLSEADGGVKMRMFCNECAKTLDGALGQVNRTCQTFDPSSNVASDIKAFELNAEYQAKLAQVQEEQDLNAREAAMRAEGNPNASVDVDAVAKTINAGISGIKDLFR